MLLFSCQMITKEASNINNSQSTKACFWRCIKAQLAEDPSISNKNEPNWKLYQNAMLTGRLVNGKVKSSYWSMYRNRSGKYHWCTNTTQIDVLKPRFQCCRFQQYSCWIRWVAANVGINFVLEGINRKATTKHLGEQETMKSSKRGGIDPTPTTKLNMWACTIGGGILGYAQFPGGSMLQMVSSITIFRIIRIRSFSL
jgi:hypothetical protein